MTPSSSPPDLDVERGLQVESSDTSNVMSDVQISPTVSPRTEKESSEQAESPPTTRYISGFPLFIVFIGLSSATFLIMLDQTILSPAMPVIASHFNALSQVGWIASSYFLTQCAAILLWGQVLAIFSQKITLLIAIALFELGSLIAGVAQNFDTLIVGRCISGMGGAAIFVCAMSMVAVLVELKKRPLFFAGVGVNIIIGSSLGPLIGGGLTTAASWRWCFFINLPIGAVSWCTVAWFIPRISPPPPPEKFTRKTVQWLEVISRGRLDPSPDRVLVQLLSLDWIASIIVLGGITCLTLALVWGGAGGWSSPKVIITLVFAAVALILFSLWEILVVKDNAMLPLRVLRRRSVWGAALISFGRGFSLMVVMYYLPIFFQATRNQSSLKSSISCLPYTFGLAIFGMISAMVVKRVGRYKWALLLGSIVSCIGPGLLFSIKDGTSYAMVAGYQIISALGIGMVMQNANLATQADLESAGKAKDIPQASAFVGFIMLLGSDIGSSIGDAILTTCLRQYLPRDVDVAAILDSVTVIWTLADDVRDSVIVAYVHALNNVFIAGIAGAILSIIGALLCKDLRLSAKAASP